MYLSNQITFFYFRLVYSGDSIFVVDSKWPHDYVQDVLDKASPDFVIFDDSSSCRLNSFSSCSNQWLQARNFELRENDTPSTLHFNDLAYVIATSGWYIKFGTSYFIME
jgi:hypothetical protein